MSATYDDIVRDFHNDLANSDYTRFGQVEVTSTGMTYFDSALEDVA